MGYEYPSPEHGLHDAASWRATWRATRPEPGITTAPPMASRRWLHERIGPTAQGTQ